MPTLNNYAEAQIEWNKISGNDKLVRSYIDKAAATDFCYDAIIEGDNNWQVFYNLSDLRTGILNWYEFKENSKVLEVGAGFGALTGVLCKKCKEVHVTERSLFRGESIALRYPDFDNLTIHIGDIAEEEFVGRLPKDFDYIVLVGLLERIGNGSKDRQVYADYLRRLASLLNTDGKMLIAVENRFGLRYFCGAPEPHTNRAFDGIDGYRRGAKGRSFSREEFCEILSAAGMEDVKMYYPLPDYKLPQLIYTDAYLPEKNLSERLILYYARNTTLVARESLLYDDVVANGVFPFFANSFFAEYHANKNEDFCSVEYAAVSTDRGRERSFATTIHSDKTVHKNPLYPDGVANAKTLNSNVQDLKNHGIPVVEHELSETGNISMPYISFPTLSNYIKDNKQDKALIMALLDKLYANILSASEVVCDDADSEAKMKNKLLDYAEEEEKALPYGPILKKAYMELIPLNCFINPETKELLYFDQEFVREYYPAKYVLFRAIHYIYIFTDNMEQYISREEVVAHFQMQEIWKVFEKEERRFLDEVRNRKRYSQFYRRTVVDDKKIFENSAKLESETEVVAEYEISDKMKKTWKAELAMLDEVERICKTAGLKYFLVHGSLLGAVRHKGFIPWDDALDIAMPRADYEKFLQLAQKEIKEPMVLCTPGCENDLYWGGATRIRNIETTAIEPKDLNHKGKLGIWIDILPYDVCPDDEKLLNKKVAKLRFYHQLMNLKVYGKDHKLGFGKQGLINRFYLVLSQFYSMKSLAKKLDKALHLYTNEESSDVAFFTGGGMPKILSAKFFEDTVLMDFENRKVPAPVGYKDYLFATLGGDYMKFPPLEERQPKHKGIYDPEMPYTKYQNMLCNMFDDIKGKQIVLWGSGFMFEDYMKKYGDKYRPAYLVDNDKNKWGRSRMGIEIKAPEELLKIPAEKRKLIICSYYYKEIEKQLEEMGISEYKVYVQKMEWILKAENDGKEV